MKWLGVLLLLVLCSGAALAQGGVPTVDPSRLGGDVGSLSALLILVVEFIKAQLARQGKKLAWWAVLLLTLLLAEGAAALLFYSGYGAKFGSAPPPWTWLLFGLVAAVGAAGGKDLLTKLIALLKGEQAPEPRSGTREHLPGPALAHPDLLPGFRPDTVEDIMKATGTYPAIPGLDDDAPLAGQR